MATIKSYTNIEQSRKLAEILPLDSADGGWYGTTNPYAANTHLWLGTKYSTSANFPAWSLTALLDIIKEQGNVDLRFLKSTFDNRGNHLTNVWCCTFEDIGSITLDLYADNSIETCYEMILKLHELKLRCLWTTKWRKLSSG